MTAGALRRFLDAYSVVPDLPVAIVAARLRPGRLRAAAPADAGPAALVRAMLAQLARLPRPRRPADRGLRRPGAPAALGVGEVAAARPAPDPHGRARAGAAGRQHRAPSWRSCSTTCSATGPGSARPAGDRHGPHVVVVLDGGDLTGADHLMTDGGVDGVTVLDLDEPPPRLLDRATLVLDVAGADGRVTGTTMDGAAEVGQAGHARRRPRPRRWPGGWRRCGWPRPSRTADAAAGRRPGPGRAARHRRPGRRSTSAQALGAPAQPRPAAGADRRRRRTARRSSWTSRSPRRTAWARTGCSSARPAPASRELLRTLVLGAGGHAPSETLNFVLVDFKGGATFASLDRLPHTAAVITNLADELPLVDRMVDAIDGELIRRQELLRRAGNYASLRDYERARAGGAALAPLPRC